MNYAGIIGLCLLEVHEKGEQAIKTICSCSVPSHVMMVEYGKLKVKLEDLPKEERQEMWEVAHDMFPNSSKDFRIRVCRLIHVIGTLL